MAAAFKQKRKNLRKSDMECAYQNQGGHRMAGHESTWHKITWHTAHAWHFKGSTNEAGLTGESLLEVHMQASQWNHFLLQPWTWLNELYTTSVTLHKQHEVRQEATHKSKQWWGRSQEQSSTSPASSARRHHLLTSFWHPCAWAWAEIHLELKLPTQVWSQKCTKSRNIGVNTKCNGAFNTNKKKHNPELLNPGIALGHKANLWRAKRIFGTNPSEFESWQTSLTFHAHGLRDMCYVLAPGEAELNYDRHPSIQQRNAHESETDRTQNGY